MAPTIDFIRVRFWLMADAAALRFPKYGDSGRALFNSLQREKV